MGVSVLCIVLGFFVFFGLAAVLVGVAVLGDRHGRSAPAEEERAERESSTPPPR